MKFIVPNYSCLQNPRLGGYLPQIPVLSVLCPQLNLLNPPPRTQFLGMPLCTVGLFSDQPTSEMIRMNSGVLKTWIASKPWLARDVG
jgi:hypothetical protein